MKIIIRQILPILGFILLAIMLQSRYELESSGIAVERFYLSDSFNTPVIHFPPAVGSRNGTVAILVHGIHCNKTMLAQLARYLAASGVDAFSIDLPGHGESLSSFSVENAQSATESAVREIAERTNTHPDHMVLIGYSLGAMALGPTALRQDFLASVFIAPGRIDNMNRSMPKNVLIIIGENDYDFIKKYSQAVYVDLTGSEAPPSENLVGDFRAKDARAWEEIPEADHYSLLINQRVERRVAKWIELATNGTISPKSSNFLDPARRGALTALALGLIVLSMLSKYLSKSSILGTYNQSCTWVFPATAIIVGVLIAVAVTRDTVLLRFLRLEEGETMASVLAVTGIFGSGVFLSEFGEKFSFRLTAKDMFVAAAAFASLYVLAIFSIDGEFYNIRISSDDFNRCAILLIISVLVAPFFALQEEVFQRLRSISDNKPIQLITTCGISIIVAIMFCCSLYFVGLKIFRFNTALIAALLLYCAIASALLHAQSRNAGAGVIFSSLATGWILSVGYLHY